MELLSPRSSSALPITAGSSESCGGKRRGQSRLFSSVSKAVLICLPGPHPQSVLSMSLLLFPPSPGLEASSGHPLPPAPGFRPHHWSHTAASWLVLPPTWSTSAGIWAASARAHTLRAPRRGVHRGTPGGRKAPGCMAVAWTVSAGGGSHVVFYPERFFLPF